MIYPDDEDAQVLAYFLDSKLPALTIKEQDGYTSIYCGSKILSCNAIKEFARFAGCHIYSETDDVVYANRNYVTIHGAFSGTKTIRLPEKRDVVDAYEGTLIATDTDTFCVDMLRGETRMFRLK